MVNMEQKIVTISEKVEDNDHGADLDHALAVVGLGWYNIKYCLVLGLLLIGAIVEPLGYSFILPAALCDLNMTEQQRGFISSIPYIGIVLTSFPWGFLVDTTGRKRTLVISALLAGTFGVISAFMPELISFAIAKFITALCIAGPAAGPYTFIGEILPPQHRDILLSITNALQIMGSALVPLLAWAILPLDFRIDFGAYIFRPWRLLTIVYACVFLLGALLISLGPESPKYLVSEGKYDEALKVLQVMYAKNKGTTPDKFPIKKLEVVVDNRQQGGFLTSLKVQTLPLLRPPYLKWMALNGFLLFGIFAALNGLYMWVPDVLNRVMTSNESGRTTCQVIRDRISQESVEGECVDTIENITFMINSVANVSCAIIAVVVSSTVKIIGKKRLLITVFILIGIFTLLINFISQEMVFAVLLSSYPIMGLAIGPVNAFAVEIFPTFLRGMAVSLTMMVGRAGSIVGTNVAGVLIHSVCEVTFYLFGGLLIFCGLLSFLLPSSRNVPSPRPKLEVDK